MSSATVVHGRPSMTFEMAARMVHDVRERMPPQSPSRRSVGFRPCAIRRRTEFRRLHPTPATTTWRRRGASTGSPRDPMVSAHKRKSRSSNGRENPFLHCFSRWATAAASPSFILPGDRAPRAQAAGKTLVIISRMAAARSTTRAAEGEVRGEWRSELRHRSRLLLLALARDPNGMMVQKKKKRNQKRFRQRPRRSAYSTNATASGGAYDFAKWRRAIIRRTTRRGNRELRSDVAARRHQRSFRQSRG